MFPKSNSSIILEKLLVISIMFITGCATTQSLDESPTPTFSRFLPPTWTPSITSTPTTTLIPTVTKTFTPTIVPSLTPTITQTLPPSLTPLPTIPIDSLAWNFEILLATNGNCRLPCFWGLTPGITTIDELEQFAHQFPEDLVDIGKNRSTIYYVSFKTGDTSFSVDFFVKDGLIQSIDLKVDTARYYVTLPKLLGSYGMPTQILIGPSDYEPNLSMLVLYEDQQFMGQYFLFQNPSDKSLYCYDPQFSATNVITWSDQDNWQSFIVHDEQSYKPLDDLSNYNIPSLQNILKNPNRSLCMKIQVDKMLP